MRATGAIQQGGFAALLVAITPLPSGRWAHARGLGRDRKPSDRNLFNKTSSSNNAQRSVSVQFHPGGFLK